MVGAALWCGKNSPDFDILRTDRSSNRSAFSFFKPIPFVNPKLLQIV
jgi:hypothetical protein